MCLVYMYIYTVYIGYMDFYISIVHHCQLDPIGCGENATNMLPLLRKLCQYKSSTCFIYPDCSLGTATYHSIERLLLQNAETSLSYYYSWLLVFPFYRGTASSFYSGTIKGVPVSSFSWAKRHRHQSRSCKPRRTDGTRSKANTPLGRCKDKTL